MTGKRLRALIAGGIRTFVDLAYEDEVNEHAMRRRFMHIGWEMQDRRWRTTGQADVPRIICFWDHSEDSRGQALSASLASVGFRANRLRPARPEDRKSSS